MNVQMTAGVWKHENEHQKSNISKTKLKKKKKI